MATPPEVPRLSALALDAIRTATDRYLEDGDAARWERDVSATLARSHQAAWLLGTAERLGVPLDSKLLNARNLSREERAQIRETVAEQVDYLRRFIDQADGLSDAQVRARADLYALAPKASYWKGWAGQDLECVPGECDDCLSNCRCHLERESDGVHWVCVEDQHSCAACLDRAATWPLAGDEPREREEATDD